MNYTTTLLILCPLVFLAGFIDAIAGGGGLISLPAYMLAGLPPHNALGCNKFSAVFGATASFYQFSKSGNLRRDLVVRTIIASLCGSAAGTQLALKLSDIFLKKLMLFLLPAVLVFILFNRDFGANKTPWTGKKLLIGACVLSFFIGMYDGFFGPGTGTFLILAFTSILGFDILTASGNAKAVNWASNLASLTVFLLNGKILFAISIPAALCSLLGAHLGSRLAIKNGLKLIRPIFILVILLLMGKIILDMRGI